MCKTKYVFGPVPSRRLGRSLGVSPIPKKTCNYSCVYCQLGRTNKMTNTRQEFFPLADILAEFDRCLSDLEHCDVVSVVGEGEPTLYARLGELIDGIRARTDKPVAVITNGALLSDPAVRADLSRADIVLPSMDSCDEDTWHRADRPHGRISYQEMLDGLIAFTHSFSGQIFMEIMLMDGINDSPACLEKFKQNLSRLRYDRLYLNTPVRPPAESDVRVSAPETIALASELLGGISIDTLASGSFFSEVADDYEAILSIIGRHPMNQHEISGFLESRGVADPAALLEKLGHDPRVNPVNYKGYITYRLK